MTRSLLSAPSLALVLALRRSLAQDPDLVRDQDHPERSPDLAADLALVIEDALAHARVLARRENVAALALEAEEDDPLPGVVLRRTKSTAVTCLFALERVICVTTSRSLAASVTCIFLLTVMAAPEDLVSSHMRTRATPRTPLTRWTSVISMVDMSGATLLGSAHPSQPPAVLLLALTAAVDVVVVVVVVRNSAGTSSVVCVTVVNTVAFLTPLAVALALAAVAVAEADAPVLAATPAKYAPLISHNRTGSTGIRISVASC